MAKCEEYSSPVNAVLEHLKCEEIGFCSYTERPKKRSKPTTKDRPITFEIEASTAESTPTTTGNASEQNEDGDEYAGGRGSVAEAAGAYTSIPIEGAGGDVNPQSEHGRGAEGTDPRSLATGSLRAASMRELTSSWNSANF